MNAPKTFWHGTPEEAEELEFAVKQNCQCVYSESDGHRLSFCEPHKMMALDQRALDGLLEVRRNRDYFIGKEVTYE